MQIKQLITHILQKRSYLCVGLDTDIEKIPAHLLSESDPVFSFNKAIIDATREYCVAYKINTAFYESMGVKGWQSLQKTVDYIPAEHFKIADAKRGDIGNTSHQYAKTFFEIYPFDAVTVAPYMGADSVKPFLKYNDKCTILLGLTSNEGSADFQLQRTGKHYLYEDVLIKAQEWGTPQNLLFVIGATQLSQIENARKIAPDHFFLVPGVGAQGGDLQEISRKGLNDHIGLLVNVSRSIIYASKEKNFAEGAGNMAQQYQQEMSKYLKDLYKE
jgi:orotidine-5'-phosphate decarboxylase